MRILNFVLLILPLTLAAQSIKVIDLVTSDIVFNHYDNKIYATTPSSAGALGNSICIIDPVTAVVDTAVFIGSEPAKIGLSDNGEMLYVALDGAAAVRPFSAKTRSSGQQFSLGSDPFSGPYYVEDIEVLSGSTNSIAVALRNQGFSPKHEGVSIYDGGVARPNTTQDHTGSNVIEIVSSNLMIGYNNETTEYGLRTIQIISNGVQETNVYRNMISGFGVDIHYSRDRIYSTYGKAIDISSGTPALLASFFEASGPVVEDTSQNLVCYAYQDFWGDEVLIKRYSAINFILKDTLVISDSLTSGDVLNLISWGANGNLAYNTSAGKLVIIDQTGLSVEESEVDIDLKIFPNPTSDYLTLYGQPQHGAIQILITSSSGEVLARNSVIELPYKMDLSRYNPGVYFLRVASGQFSVTKKLLKQ